MLKYTKHEKDLLEMFGYDKIAARILSNFFDGKVIKFGDKEVAIKKVMPLCSDVEDEFCYELYANKEETYIITVNNNLNSKINTGDKTVKICAEETDSGWYLKEMNVGTEVLNEI